MNPDLRLCVCVCHEAPQQKDSGLYPDFLTDPLLPFSFRPAPQEETAPDGSTSWQRTLLS